MFLLIIIPKEPERLVPEDFDGSHAVTGKTGAFGLLRIRIVIEMFGLILLIYSLYSLTKYLESQKLIFLPEVKVLFKLKATVCSCWKQH